MNAARSFDIPKQLVVQAYKAVKANAGSAGIDDQSIKDFEENLKDNLYKIWNRMSSGSYLQPEGTGPRGYGSIDKIGCVESDSRTWNAQEL